MSEPAQQSDLGLEPFPKTAQFSGLNDREIAVVEAIVHKSPKESWEQVAKRLKISRRTLYTYRQDARIQDLLLSVTLDILKTDVVDVVKALAEEAKKGNVGAAKVILEYAGRAWDLEQRYKQQLSQLKEVILRSLEQVSPELMLKMANELERIELDSQPVKGTQGEGRGKALPEAG